MPIELRLSERVECWRIIGKPLEQSFNAFAYEVRFDPGIAPPDHVRAVKRRLNELEKQTGIPPTEARCFLKQFGNPAYRIAKIGVNPLLKEYSGYQNRILEAVNSCWRKCSGALFCPELDSFICDDPGKQGYYQVQEYYPDCRSLTECLKNNSLSWKERVFHAYSMTEALRHLHKAGVIHADLKPDNFLVLENRREDDGGRLADIPTKLKIIDFDSSIFENEGAPRSKRGTPRYYSPEHIDKGTSLIKKSDVFTTAVILCELLSPHKGEHGFVPGMPEDGHPFQDEPYADAVRNGKYNLRGLLSRTSSKRNYVPDITVETIRQALSFNPACRPTMEDLWSAVHEIPRPW